MAYRCRSFHCGPDRRTAVYRLYDRHERLLYAGIAYDYAQRWMEHARDKDWWPKVAYRTAVTHETRLAAAIEEYCAIRYENPLHNLNRDHDRRLGVEKTDAPGFHAPRPWRLHLITTAKRMGWDGAAVEAERPHHPAVISPGRDGLPATVSRVWFPRIPQIGVVELERERDASDYLGLHDAAAGVVADYLDLDDGEFTLSLHEADRCPAPAVAVVESPPEDADPGPATMRQRFAAAGRSTLKWYDRIVMGWWE